MTAASDLRDIARNHQRQVLQWTAQTGLSIYGMGGMLYAPGIVLNWHHQSALHSPSPITRLLPALGVTVWVAAIVAWGLFTLHYVAATRIAVITFAVGATMWALGSAVTTEAGPPALRYLWVVAASLTLLPLYVIGLIVYRIAPALTRADTVDLTRPRLNWLLAQPLYVLTLAVFWIGLYSTTVDGQGLFDGSPLAAVAYGIAVLGGATLGALRKRATAPWAALAAACATALGIPLAIAGLLISHLTAAPATRMVIEMALLIVLTPTLLLLARHRLHTATTDIPAPVACSAGGTE